MSSLGSVVLRLGGELMSDIGLLQMRWRESRTSLRLTNFFSMPAGRSMTAPQPANRRDFLTGRALQAEIEQRAQELGDALIENLEPRPIPKSGPLVKLSTRAMACEFHVMLNAGRDSAVETWHASDALDVVHRMEDLMTVYREHSPLIDLNRRAAAEEVEVDAVLFEVLQLALQLARETDGAFDPTAMPLVRVWRHARAENRIPTQEEIDAAKSLTGFENVALDVDRRAVAFNKVGIELQLNAIGKGFALDRAADVLKEHEIANWLLHGGHSSVLASGDHFGQGGWPVGVRNPLFPDEQLATVLLKNEAMGTSGNSVQFFRWQGRRFGHILDPRTGWPADSLLQATVLAPTSAEADALSTAFFVMGLEKAQVLCQNRPAIKALLVPFPRAGRVLEPVNCGIPADQLFFAPSSNVVPSGAIPP